MPRIAIYRVGPDRPLWSVVFSRGLRSSRSLTPWTASPPRRASIVGGDLEELAAQGVVKDAKAAHAHIRVAESLADALDGADLVQENAPETLEAKLAVFAELDAAAAPSTILASSTSGIVASAFTEKLKGPRALSGRSIRSTRRISPPSSRSSVRRGRRPRVIERARKLYAEHRSGTGRREQGDRRLHHQSPSGGVAVGSVSSGRRRLSRRRISTRPSSDGLGLRWAFMDPVRDHRAQCARRHS